MNLNRFLSTRPFFIAISGLLFLIALVPVHAEETLPPPQLVIQATSEALQQALKEGGAKDDFDKTKVIVERVLDPRVDFDRLSMLVLGKHWKNATADQKTRFKREFRILLIRTYAAAFSSGSDWTVDYLPLRMKPDDKRVVVKTKIIRAGSPPFEIAYRMIKLGGTWKVYDVIIEGISLAVNYRTSFRNDVAKTGSLDSVIELLAKKNQQGNQGT